MSLKKGRGQINSITLAAALVALSSLLSRFLGVIRDRILAGQFGAGESLDIYYAAFRVPDLIFNLVVLGALSAGFIPVFTNLLKKDEDEKNNEAWKLASNVLNFLSLAIFLLSLLGIIFVNPLVRLIVPGFSPEAQLTTAKLTRIMFLSPLFLGISGVLGGILQSTKRFLVYSIAPVAYNLGIIFGALYLFRWFGIYGLAWGVVIGALLHAAIQLPAVLRLGFKWSMVLDWRDKNTRKIGRMMVPRTLSLAVSQIDALITTVIASLLPGGTLTIFNLANNLQSFPVGIFGVSFAIAAFPSFSENAFNPEILVKKFTSTMRQIIFFVIPTTVFIITLRAQIIRVVLGSGSFDWNDTVLTMNALGLFSISLVAQAAAPLLVRVFYARHNSKTPLYIGLVSVAVDILLSWFLGMRMGSAGLALAVSISSAINFILLWLFLYIEVPTLNSFPIFITALKYSAAALLAGVAIQISKVAIWPYIDMTRFYGVFIQLLVSISAGTLVYAFICKMLGSEEMDSFLGAIKGRWRFKKVTVEDQSEARGN
ncbi:MAG: murein biosynthesis integral membrane protein MurJ [Candidatus Falkowbacteria bacterium]|nr:murein biosynthesis integral membrane protein MurJ [Candidatus Falkowbacteria bacterium]